MQTDVLPISCKTKYVGVFLKLVQNDPQDPELAVTSSLRA
jgi:hypothetical protein